MKKILSTVVLGLLLSGCVAQPGYESSTLTGFIMLGGIIAVTIILGPFVWGLEKARDIKNPKLSLFVWIVILIVIIVVMITMGSIFAFIGRILGFGN